ncbi:MAG: hypothetical protein Tsb0020_17730 [Haliangiales bacterium]
MLEAFDGDDDQDLDEPRRAVAADGATGEEAAASEGDAAAETAPPSTAGDTAEAAAEAAAQATAAEVEAEASGDELKADVATAEVTEVASDDEATAGRDVEAAAGDAAGNAGDAGAAASDATASVSGSAASASDAVADVAEAAGDAGAERAAGAGEDSAGGDTAAAGDADELAAARAPKARRPVPEVDLDSPVYMLAGVKFSASGRIHLYDAGDGDYARGEQVVVESERGVRVGTIAVAAVRKAHRRGRQLKQILRRPNRGDLRTIERNHARAEEALRDARAVARRLEMPIKVFRAEPAHTGKRLVIYFTAEERIDFRALVRELSRSLNCRVEMRQTGVRDEARAVGGIGSCGRELCCTTWLPEFVPVSIKMAKDQGLVLNPTKVSGQCGRLKCCLVYEQATYAELRKGLPKLGKRVITSEGDEGRVVEVDVLRQRVRVSLGPGDFRVLTADEVKPMFPSQPQRGGRKSAAPE